MFVNFAYTYLDIEDENGEETTAWEPENIIKCSVDYKFEQLSELTLGLGGRWQSEVENTAGSVKHNSYLLLNAFTRWDATEKLAMNYVLIVFNT